MSQNRQMGENGEHTLEMCIHGSVPCSPSQKGNDRFVFSATVQILLMQALYRVYASLFAGSICYLFSTDQIR